MVTRPVAKTMALGGVPTGSMKARLSASVAGTSSSKGSIPIPGATAPRIGMIVAAMAVFEAISVIITTIATSATTTQTVGRLPRPDTLCPNQASSPVEDTAAARLRPPPNSSSTPQGRPSSASFQSSSICVLPRPGRMNSRIPAAMAVAVSSKPPNQGAAALRAGTEARMLGTVQKKAAPRKTSSTIRSPWLRGPRSRICASISPRPPGISGRSKRYITRVIRTQPTSTKTRARGTPIIIHLTKLISRSSVSAA